MWVEAYSRGYQGSPCKDSKGNWCFNPTDVRKYGYANKIKVPVGTAGVKVVLPTTCGYGGTAGSIVGKGVDSAGRPVTLSQVYAWTESSWNAAPGLHGWGAHKPTSSTLRRAVAGGRPDLPGLGLRPAGQPGGPQGREGRGVQEHAAEHPRLRRSGPHTGRVLRRSPLLLAPFLLAALALPAAAQEAPDGAPAPAPAPAEPALTGTIDGTDGRAVNALLGFDWLDAQGRHLDRNGCVQSEACPLRGYATVLRTNPTLPATGSADTSTATTTWSVQPPPGAVRLFLEAYPQDERLRTVEERYGHAMRHGVALPHDGPLPLRLPLVRCDEGGAVGTVRGTATRDGAPAPLTRVVAWSLEAFDPVSRPVLGWNIGTASADGTFVVPNLVADQRYQVWVTAADGAVRKSFGVAVPRCAETQLAVSFDPPPVAEPAPEEPAPVPPPPAPVLPRSVVGVGESAVVEGTAAPGAAVELLAADRPGGALRVVRTGTASPSGYYVFSVAPTTTTELRVRTGGEPGAPAVLQVRSRVSAGYARTAPKTYRVSGGVRPARAQDVALYLRTGGGRRLLSTARTGADGRYAFSRRFAVAGTLDLFVVARADARNAEGASPVTRVPVR